MVCDNSNHSQQYHAYQMWKYKSTYTVCKMISATIDYTGLNRERAAKPSRTVLVCASEYT